MFGKKQSALHASNPAAIQGKPATAWAPLILGLVIVSAAGIGAYFVLLEHPEPHGSWVVAALIPVGLWLLFVAKSMRRQQQYVGTLTLRLAGLQPRVGGRLRGLIEFDAPPRERQYELLLICERYYYGKGDDDGRTERLWEKELRLAPVGNRLVFDFHPSADAPPSEPLGDGSSRWQLVLKSEAIVTPLRFDVLLYPAQPGSTQQDESLSVEGGPELRLREDDIPPRVAVLEIGMNRLRIVFAATRHRSVAALLLVVWVAFSGIAAFILATQAPGSWPFALVFGLVSLLCLYFGLRLIWRPCSVEIKQGSLMVRKANLFGRTEDGCTTKEVDKLGAVVGYSSTRGGGIEASYYELKILTQSGRVLDAGDGVPSSWMAERLLQHMRAALGESVEVLPLDNLTENRRILAATSPVNQVALKRFIMIVAIGMLFLFGYNFWQMGRHFFS